MSNWIAEVIADKKEEKIIPQASYCVVEMSSIIIPATFLLHPPSEIKLTQCNNFYEKHGYLDRQIVLNTDNVLIDGYIGYIVLLQHNTEYCGVSIIE